MDRSVLNHWKQELQLECKDSSDEDNYSSVRSEIDLPIKSSPVLAVSGVAKLKMKVMDRNVLSQWKQELQLEYLNSSDEDNV